MLPDMHGKPRVAIVGAGNFATALAVSLRRSGHEIEAVIARSRAEAGKGGGADYLYTLWRSFYRDETRPTGWNNLAYPNIAMPHALWLLQGERLAVFVDEKDPHEPEKTERRFGHFEQMAVVQVVSPSLECRYSPKCGGGCSDVC